MYDFMVWYISQENIEIVAKSMGANAPAHANETTIFGIPVKLIDNDEVSLVLRVVKLIDNDEVSLVLRV